jgi:hypothetical protein
VSTEPLDTRRPFGAADCTAAMMR